MRRTSQALHEGWTFRQVGRAESYPAAVPGIVHLDLLENKPSDRILHGPRDKNDRAALGGWGICKMASRKPSCS